MQALLLAVRMLVCTHGSCHNQSCWEMLMTSPEVLYAAENVNMIIAACCDNASNEKKDSIADLLMHLDALATMPKS